ncbi:subtilisin-like protease SBT3.3 isoform X1 [Humulus lupulus]|uniref:subtilisin-like protease SBT3.3 isoform X1 n=1 Tax=Humulus lupulus TaxID=3486 RepID=UPI002B417A5F|nr:subtilisin-like protease SBT3.3 isoform X1 [Humulus lupulus]
MNVPLTSMLILAWLVFVLIGQRMATMVAAKTNNIHIVYLGEKKHHDPDLITDCHHDLLAKIVGSKEKAVELMVYSYRHGFSGFAAKLTESQAQDIAGNSYHYANNSYNIETQLV